MAIVKDYLTLVSENHPSNPASCDGDSTVYSNIVWHATAVTEATLDGEYLAYKKKCRYAEIDVVTKSLIYAGFTYDAVTFSLSIAAQSNWNALKDAEVEFTWPVEISTFDNNVYSLLQANLAAFWTAGKDALHGHLNSGRTLKKSIYDAATEAAVDAVVDTR